MAYSTVPVNAKPIKKKMVRPAADKIADLLHAMLKADPDYLLNATSSGSFFSGHKVRKDLEVIEKFKTKANADYVNPTVVEIQKALHIVDEKILFKYSKDDAIKNRSMEVYRKDAVALRDAWKKHSRRAKRPRQGKGSKNKIRIEVDDVRLASALNGACSSDGIAASLEETLKQQELLTQAVTIRTGANSRSSSKSSNSSSNSSSSISSCSSSSNISSTANGAPDAHREAPDVIATDNKGGSDAPAIQVGPMTHLMEVAINKAFAGSN